jgi:hypothetical protein
MQFSAAGKNSRAGIPGGGNLPRLRARLTVDVD